MTSQIIDVTKKFVRVTNRRPDGFVEFDFAIGEPELFVELLMSESAFNEFCADNGVVLQEGPRAGAEDPDDWDWRLKEATSQRFK